MLQKKDNPWLGLASYEYKDAYRFFGREKELSELKTAICNNPFTIIYGISGAGKTSLINAGMIPTLEKENYLPVRIRLEHQSKIGYNTQIIQAVKAAVDRVDGEMELMTEFDNEKVVEDEKLWNFLFTSKIWSRTNHQLIPVVFIDQFEEIFTMTEDQDKVLRFFETINSLQYNTPPNETSILLEEEQKYIDFNDAAQFRMVFIMREDFLARLEDNSTDIPALRKNRKGIKRMDGHQALEVILCPYPSVVSREVALKILGKVVGKEVRDSEAVLSRLSVDTSILSLFCSELYQRAVDANREVITKELVGQFGDDIIASFYANTMNLVSNETMEYLEAHLLTYSGFRNSVALEDLMQNGIKPEELMKLAEKRLIRIETMDGTERVEFMHDVLCKVAKEHKDARNEKIKQNARLKHIRRSNIGFITSAIIGMIALIVVSMMRGQRFGYLPLCGTMSINLPYVLFFSLSLGGIYLLLFEKKFSKYLIIRYLLVLIIAIMTVLGIYAIYTCLYNGDWHRRYIMFNHFDANDLIVRFLPFAFCLVVSFFLDCFSKRAVLLAISKALAMLTLVGAVTVFGFTSAWALVLYFFALFILLPYRFSKEKNTWWIVLLSGIMVTIPFLLWFPNDELIVPCFVLLSIGCSIFCLLRYKKDRSAKEAWNYCVSLKIYKEHPLFVKTIVVIALLLVFAFSAQVGLRLVDRYTLLGIVFFVPVSYVLIKYLIFGTTNLRLKLSPSILFLLLLVGIVASQYLYGRFVWLVLVWIAASFYVLKYSNPHNSSTSSRWTFKKDVLPYLLIWFVSFFCIPILCMGYNVFSLPQYARVYNKDAVYVEYAFPYLPIKDHVGMVGVRGRNGLLVPMEFKSVSKGENRVKHGRYAPCAFFGVTKQDGKQEVWDCSDHLDMNNDFTRQFVDYYEQLTDSRLSFTDEGVKKYAIYICSMRSEPQLEQLVEKILIYNLQKCASRNNDYMSIHAISDIRNMNESIEAEDFAYSISQTAPYFSYLLNSNRLSRLVADTLYRNCANYETSVNYSDLVKYRIIAKDYKKAVADAYKSVGKGENLAYCRLIEALYFNEEYLESFSLLEEMKNELVVTDTISDFTRTKKQYLGDIVWQEMLGFKQEGMVDTVWDAYISFMELMRLEATHPPYDYVDKMPNVNGSKKMWNFLESDTVEICIKEHEYRYLMLDHRVVSPIMKSFAFSDDGFIMLYVDEVDGKRKYMDVSGDCPRLLHGSFDHGWRFYEGVAVVAEDNKIGVIDRTGKFVVEPRYKMPSVYYHYGHHSFVGTTGITHDNILSRENIYFVDFIFQNGLCPMCDVNKWGLVDKHGNWVLEPKCDFIGEPDEKGIRPAYYIEPVSVKKSADSNEITWILYDRIDINGHLMVSDEVDRK